MNNLDGFLNKIHCGDALTLLKELPDESIDCCITSPPYYGLRSYAHDPHIWDGEPNCEHEWGNKKSFCVKCNAWKGRLGLEPTFGLYIKHLIDIFKEVKRVLKKTGCVFVNIGDTYSGSNCGKGDYREDKSLQKDIYNKSSPQSLSSRFSKWRRDGEGGEAGNCLTKVDSDIPVKSLIGIPERFKIAMTDELNFICRNTIIWHKPNCMPASVSDRFTVDFEFLYFFTVSPKYYFEQQFEPSIDPESYNGRRKRNPTTAYKTGDKFLKQNIWKLEGVKYPERNKRCVWAITTKGFNGTKFSADVDHFATFPEALIETPIKAGCPEGGIVLDCFAGSGTTALVALRLNRQYIGFELSQKYVDMANKRLKPFKEQGRIEFATPIIVG